MQVNTRSYGVVSGNARYDCPYCSDTKGRFFISIQGNKKGSYICHNCGVRSSKSMTAEEEEELFLASLTGEEEKPKEWALLQYTFDQTNRVRAFLISRGIKPLKDTYPTMIYVLRNGKIPEKKSYGNRMLLKGMSLDPLKEFYNFRALDSDMFPKVLFPMSSYVNIAKKSEALLWNPDMDRKSKKPVIPVICEGDMGAWSVHHETETHRYVGVAVFGKYISILQAKYFQRFSQVLYMPDNDVEYKDISNNVDRLNLVGCPDVRVYDKSQYMGPKDDPNDLLQLDLQFFNANKFKK